MMNKSKYFKIKFISFLIITPLFADAWHPDINHRPRTLFLSDEIDSIKDRLDEEPYHSLWNNSYGSNQSIYQNARRSIELTGNSLDSPRASFDKRSWIAKDAAFVYIMNRKSDGVTDLNNSIDEDNPWEITEYFNRAVLYLETLDPTVIGPNNILQLETHGPMINNWQYRVRELISYCQAYDLLLGAGMEINEIIESKLSTFANNLLNKYTATEYTNQYLLQRNNHKLTIGAALGMAAIVLNQDDDATSWANAGMLLINWVCFGEPANGIDGYNLIDQDGGYAEGSHYMHYSWKKLAPFLVAMKNFNGDWSENYSSLGMEGFYPNYDSATDLNLQSPIFDERYRSIYNWAMQIQLPNGTLPVIEDSPLNVFVPELSLISSDYDITFNSPILDGEIPPLIKRLTDLRSDYIAAGNYNGNHESIVLEPFVFLPDAGSAVFRSESNQGAYLHINGKNGQSRLAAAAHDQADVSHFEIAFGDHKLSLEGGYAGWNYRYDVNKGENHNIILVNGFGPRPPSGPSILVSIGSGFPPEIDLDFNTGEPSPVDGFLENPYQSLNFSYLECRSEYGQAYYRNADLETLEGQEVWLLDESDTTNVEFKRCILFIDQEYFIIRDNINSQSENNYAWRFHANAGGDTEGIIVEQDYGAIISSLHDNPTNLLVHITIPSDNPILSFPISIHSDEILGPSFYEEHKVIQAEQNGVDTEFLTVLYPFQDGEINVESIENSDEYIGLMVERLSNRYDIILSQNSNMLLEVDGFTNANGDSIPSIQTNANFAFISFEKNENFNLDGIQIFGKDNSGNNSVIINGENYDLITDPILGNKINIHEEFKSIGIDQNYPNPFNLTTKIKYFISKNSFVSINIYNLKGENIKSLVNSYKPRGSHSIYWDATNKFGGTLSTGMYIYTIQVDNYKEVKKMILVK